MEQFYLNYQGIHEALKMGHKLRVSSKSGSKIALLERQVSDRWVPEDESSGPLVVSALINLSYKRQGIRPTSETPSIRTCLDDWVEHNNEIIGVEKENVFRLTLVLPNQEPVLYVENRSIGKAHEYFAALQLEKMFYRGMKLLYEDSRDLD